MVVGCCIKTYHRYTWQFCTGEKQMEQEIMGAVMSCGIMLFVIGMFAIWAGSLCGQNARGHRLAQYSDEYYEYLCALTLRTQEKGLFCSIAGALVCFSCTIICVEMLNYLYAAIVVGGLICWGDELLRYLARKRNSI